jgi:8-oxo-dGTP pyrophosphatase MutT (NUDIX family)
VLAAAGRELVEETGYVADRLSVAGTTFLASTAMTTRHVVVALGCEPRSRPMNSAAEFTVAVLKH